MSRLLDHLIAEVTKAEKAAIKSQEDAAVAIAYAHSELENQRLVDAGIAAISDKQATDPAPIQTAAFVAALAALPKPSV
jgi:hypothetical protein